ncbi:MAG: aminotransferase class IV [Pseudomonadales bacterium]|jgi:branched-chain amino acid aminotransferase|nr:aminotransferase class IV [Pseudomonadales bacterium]
MHFWIDGAWLDADAARIPVLDHGLLYGDGVFEGIRSHSGHPFRLERHLDRLERSAAALRLRPNRPREEVAAACHAMAERLGDGYLRLIVTRGDGDLGVDPRSCPRARTILVGGAIAVTDVATHTHGARLITSSVRRPGPAAGEARIKSLNYLPSVLARLEARAAGADEALLLNDSGRVAEASAENVLCVHGDELSTPPASEGALAGITRDALLELATTQGLTVRERPLALFDLRTADEVFLSGTGAGVVPVREIDGWPLTAPGPVTQRLREALARLTLDEAGRDAHVPATPDAASTTGP